MNFPNRRFCSPSICEYQTFEGDSSLVEKRPEPKPIIGFKMNQLSKPNKLFSNYSLNSPLTMSQNILFLLQAILATSYTNHCPL